MNSTWWDWDNLSSSDLIFSFSLFSKISWQAANSSFDQQQQQKRQPPVVRTFSSLVVLSSSSGRSSSIFRLFWLPFHFFSLFSQSFSSALHFQLLSVALQSSSLPPLLLLPLTQRAATAAKHSSLLLFFFLTSLWRGAEENLVFCGVCVCVLLMLLIKRFSFLLFIFYFCLCTSVPAIVSAAFCRVCGFFLLFSLSVWLPTNVSAGSRHLSTTTTITICHNNFALDCPLRSFSCFFNSPKIPSAETFSYLSVDCVSDWLAAVAGKCVIINHQKRGVMKPKNEK